MPISDFDALASLGPGQPPPRLAGRRVLVTGASRGIGCALALGLAEAGAQLVVHARSLDHLRDLRRILAGRGVRCDAVSGDLASAAGARRVAQRALAGGPVDILVNNAGMASRGDLLNVDPRELADLFAINVTACMLLAQRLASGMMARGWGRIINVGSPYGERPASGLAAYCISKAALRMLTQCMALEWAGSGLTANAIAPIQILTDLTRPSYDDPVRRRLIDSQIPMGRWAHAEDLLGAVLLLASDDSAMMTGQTLFIDGGRMLI